MSDSDLPIYKRPVPGTSLHQGEILSSLKQYAVVPESLDSTDGVRFKITAHPIVIILSQDCDLIQQFNFRNRPASARGTPEEEIGRQLRELSAVLLCEVYDASHLKARNLLNTNEWKRVKQNKDDRYQYLHDVEPDEDLVGEGFSELGIDFRHHFTIPIDEIYMQLGAEARRRTQLDTPWMEHLSIRFAYYLGRIGLPRDHWEKEPPV
jgi:hypothetical protein